MNDFSKRIAQLSPAQLETLRLRLKNRDAAPAASEAKIALLRTTNVSPQSFAQQRLWILDKLKPGNPAYNIPTPMRFLGELDVEILGRVLTEIVRRHESLRTRFSVVDDQPVQIVEPPFKVLLPILDLSHLSETEREQEARKLGNQDAQQSFDLSVSPLWRAKVLQISEADHVLLLTTHHIATDAWSLSVLLKEIVQLYKAYLAGQPSPLPELPFQYADYANWQREWLQGQVLEEQLSYWKQNLAGAPLVLELPTDRPRPPIQTFNGARFSLQLNKELSEQLVELSRSQGVTLFMTLLAAWQVLLHRYSGQSDIVVGSPVANRKGTEVEKLIGFFVNTVAIRNDLSANPRFCDFLRQVRETALKAFSHQDVPFERVVEEITLERNLNHSPLFQTVFAFQNIRVEPWKLPGLTLSSLELDTGHAKFDISFALANSDQGIWGRIEYNTDLFREETIERLLRNYKRVLGAIVRDQEQRISEVALLAESERHELLVEWNETGREFAGEKSLVEMFEEQVDLAGDGLAVADERQQWSYAELERRANQLSHQLRELGVGVETRVGILLPRSCELVLAALAVLKAGGAYVPLDPQQPGERVRFMLRDVGALVVLTTAAVAREVLGESGGGVLVVSVDAELAAGAGWEQRLRVAVEPEQLAYLIYTSGSTGQPKGVAVTHAGLMNLVQWHQERYGVSREERASQVASPSFDASVFEIWPLLTAGASLHIMPGAVLRAPEEIVKWLVEKEISLSFLPTPLAEAVLAERWPKQCRLRYLLTGGDKLHVVRGGDWPFELVNHYGPTENAVVATIATVGREFGNEISPSIGRPIANTEVYVLDARQTPVPVGVTGELYLSGAGLARGYWGQAELTAERFVPHPFSRRAGARMYRTGDQVRYLGSGELEFVGRVDKQVKLRGYRIELGEIEAKLRGHAGVREAVVELRRAAASGGGDRLVAYVALNGRAEEQQSVTELRSYLREQLPEYMVPSAFVLLPHLPLTANGKVDRRALASLEVQAAGPSDAFVAPRNELEKQLAQVWREVLEIEQVGMYDNFFDLGGHSLLLIRAHGKLREQLGLELSAIDLFKYPTIALLAKHVRSVRTGANQEPPQEWLMQARQRADVRRRGANQRDLNIAIIGMAGRFPGAANLSEFWDNLRRGVEAMREFSESELRVAGVSEELFLQEGYVRRGAVLDDLEWFDAEFFGMTPREAQSMDPQQRLFLECAWEAMEDAGYDSNSYAFPVGMFAGAATNSYMFQLMSNRELFHSLGGFQIRLLNDKDFLTSRVSYKLGLKGPSLTVQTACSTSLVAVHLACQSLLNGECSMALAGGVTIVLPQRSGYLFQEGGLISPDGHCRPFDAQAAGIVGGSGVGIVILKPLAAALADGDSIRAVIKGSAINNDGALKVGYTAPSIEGQSAVIAEAQAAAGVSPESISYIEAHGTATTLGDPIEIAALTQAFRAQTDARQFCAVGSVKSNIGHLDAAAGIAGLIKTVLALEHEELPPSLHYENPNPQIDFARSPFFVNAKLRDWQCKEGEMRRAGISSFGMGGTNAHLILEEAPVSSQENNTEKNDERQLLMLSARTADSLAAARQRLATHLEDHSEQALADVAYTLQVGRRSFEHRAAVVCRNRVEAVTTLRSNESRLLLESVQQSADRPVAFMFPGIGDHYVNMAAGVYAAEETFREEVDRCCEILKEHIGCDLREVFYPAQGNKSSHDEASGASSGGLDLKRMLKRGRVQVDSQTDRLNETSIAQPAVFVIEYAMARLLMRWGIKPQAMIGYSIGEYVAACLADVLSLEDALFLVASRAQLIQSLPSGGMLAVPLSETEVRDYLSAGLWIGAINGPALCVLAGTDEAISDCEEKLLKEELACRRLPTTHPFHSRLLEPVAQQFTDLVRKVKLNPPKIPYISNVTGDWIREAEILDANYWAKHMCQTVQFAAGLGELWQDQQRIMLEVGPGQSLTSLALQQRAVETAADQIALPTIRNSYEQQPDQFFLLGTLAKLWLAGLQPDWLEVHRNRSRRRVPLPTYNFDRRYYWLPQSNGNQLPSVALEKRPEIANWFYLPSWKRTIPLSFDAAAGATQERQAWLIFLDQGTIGSQIATRLEADGHEVVTVMAGETFAAASPWSYRLNRARAEDYECLLTRLQEVGRKPARIVHLWSLQPDGESLSGRDLFEDSQASGFYSLLYLAQALGRSGGERLQLDVISNQIHEVTGEETVRPENATILGPCKVIGQEYPEITCRSIDVVLPADNGREEERLAQQLVVELLSNDSAETVAHRGGYRWIQHFEPVRLATTGRPNGLRDGGVYLIAGGLGRIGLTLAAYLARQPNVKLILTGRSGLPPRETWNEWLEKRNETETSARLKNVLALEALGAELCILKANVADRDQMHEVVREAYRRFGALNGVIYLAGLVGSVFSPVQETTAAECEPNFEAKAHGLYVLEEVLEGIDLDFCVLFSSLAAVLGGLGFTAYAAANAFIDAFVHKHNKAGATHWISEDWDTWLVHEEGPHSLDFKSTQSDLNMTPEEAVTAFQAILSADALTQVVVSVGDLKPRLEKWLEHRAPDASQAASSLLADHPRPGLRNAFVAPRDEMEEGIAEIWQEVLGIKTIGVYDNFFELGGQSLLGTQIISRIRKKFQEDISVRMFFKAPTIADLAALLVQRQIERVDSATLEQLISDVRQFAD